MRNIEVNDTNGDTAKLNFNDKKFCLFSIILLKCFYVLMCLHHHGVVIKMTKSDLVNLNTPMQSNNSHTLKAFASC